MHVDHFRVERYRAGTICNYYATVSVVTNRDGRRYYYKASPKHKGCTPGYAYFQKEFPGGTFKDNSTACGTFYQDNGSKHWTACLKIHK